LSFDKINSFAFCFQAAIKNVLGDAKQIAAKTKNMEDMTGFFKTKFTGKQESVKNVLSAVSVNKIFFL
jgi:hypothetical protein